MTKTLFDTTLVAINEVVRDLVADPITVATELMASVDFDESGITIPFKSKETSVNEALVELEDCPFGYTLDSTERKLLPEALEDALSSSSAMHRLLLGVVKRALGGVIPLDTDYCVDVDDDDAPDMPYRLLTAEVDGALSQVVAAALQYAGATAADSAEDCKKVVGYIRALLDLLQAKDEESMAWRR